MQIENLYSLFLDSTGITTDSRKIDKGAIFVALKGPNFDGNQFAVSALEKGALSVIVDDAKLAKDDRYVLVEDGLVTLQNLATFHRKQLTIPIIGITGSNGKTTTKELISSVLSAKYNCYATRGNLNNHIGVPLSILEVNQQHEIAVIEMGANHVGEIALLCNIAQPTHGIITNIGAAHLEGFGGIEGVKKGKGELYDFLDQHSGVGFINVQEQFLADMASLRPNMQQKRYQTCTVSDLQQTEYCFQLQQASPFIKGAFWEASSQQKVAFTSNLFGDYNFRNIMVAAVIGQFFGVNKSGIKEAIEQYLPKNNRSQKINYKGATIFLDAYNANPTSMKNAISHLANLPGNSKILIMGDMLELGDYSQDAHREMVELAVELGIEKIVLFGKEFGQVSKRQEVLYFESMEYLKKWWEIQPLDGFTVLLKGSRGMQLEKILKNE